MNKYFLIIVLLLVGITKALSYPNFIGKGYHACLTCHYNPFGNGPLNDYGRGVAASTLAGRLFIDESTTDEHLGESAGFLFNTPKNTWFRPALDYRGLYLIGDVNDSNSEPRVIHMQMDLSTTLIFGEKKNLIISGTYGVVPSNSRRNTNDDLWFSREHYIGYRPIESLGIYVGKMDKVFGIRHPDHTAYARVNNGIAQFDATHGVMVHVGRQKFDLGIQRFIGDKEKPEDEQTEGYTGKFEYSITDNIRLGISYLSEALQNKERTANSLLAKMGIGKGSSIMFEYGNTTEIENETNQQSTSQYIFMQNHILINRGLYFMMTLEQNNPNIEQSTQNYKISPGIQYFPFQRLELRAEVTNNKLYDSDTFQKDFWSFFGQMHLWF